MPFDKLRAHERCSGRMLSSGHALLRKHAPSRRLSAYGSGNRRGYRGIENAGDDVARVQLIGCTRFAMALAAADSISSLMWRMPPSSSPRNTPGKASTLLIWLG